MNRYIVISFLIAVIWIIEDLSSRFDLSSSFEPGSKEVLAVNRLPETSIDENKVNQIKQYVLEAFPSTDSGQSNDVGDDFQGLMNGNTVLKTAEYELVLKAVINQNDNNSKERFVLIQSRHLKEGSKEINRYSPQDEIAGYIVGNINPTSVLLTSASSSQGESLTLQMYQSDAIE